MRAALVGFAVLEQPIYAAIRAHYRLPAPYQAFDFFFGGFPDLIAGGINNRIFSHRKTPLLTWSCCLYVGLSLSVGEHFS